MTAETDARMRALRQRFVDQAHAEAGLVERHRRDSAWPALGELSHGIAGRAGLFGYHRLGDAAAALEIAIETEAAPDALAALARHLADLLAEVC